MNIIKINNFNFRNVLLIIFLFLVFRFDFIFANAINSDNSTISSNNIIYDTENVEYDTFENEEIDETLLSVPISYSEESYYSITIPKNIILNENGITEFQIKINGNISPSYNIEFEIIDEIEDIDGINLYMVDNGAKLLANIIHNKTIWTYEDVKNGVQITDKIITEILYPGDWEGEIYFKISEKAIYENHIHNYKEKIINPSTCELEGSILYTCDCGYSYIDVIEMLEHKYINGSCVICGEDEGSEDEDSENEDYEDEGSEDEDSENEDYEDEDSEDEDYDDEDYEDEDSDDEDLEDEDYDDEDSDDEDLEDEDYDDENI